MEWIGSRTQRGAAAVMVVDHDGRPLAMGAAAIDIGHALVARNELQNVSDAAALAGTRALGLVYEGMTTAAQQTYVLTWWRSGCRRCGRAGDSQCEFGGWRLDHGQSGGHCHWDLGSGDQNVTLLPSTNRKRCESLSRRDASANGAISTFLANVVGMSSVSVSAVATADLSAVGQTAPGQLDVPFGISTYYFTQFGCGDAIKFYPNDGTPMACSAWHTFDLSPRPTPIH